MSFRKTLSWCLFPFTMWYGIVVGLRNLLFDIGIIKQKTVPVTTIGIGNLACGGTGKTPHVEYLLNLLAEEYNTALLSRGYRRKSKGFVMDEGSHDALELGDEPAMVARKFPHVTVAVCEKRLEGIQRLLQTNNPPQLIIMDDVYQHRFVKPTINILLTEYRHPFSKDLVMPFGDLRESRLGRRRANIIIVTKSPEKLNSIERRNLQNSLRTYPYQKVFFSYIKYGQPLHIYSRQTIDLSNVTHTLLVTGIAHPTPLIQHIRKSCKVTPLVFPDHHDYTEKDMSQMLDQFEKIHSERRIILTTEKDAARMDNDLCRKYLSQMPIYAIPIEVAFYDNKDYTFSQTIQGRVKENIYFQQRLKDPLQP